MGYFNPLYDTTLVFRENCWTQYLYRTTGRWPFVAFLPHYEPNNYALRLLANHPVEGSDRVEYTYMVSPSLREVPFVVSFDYCNTITSQEKDADSVWIDITSEHVGILQLGYITDTNNPESSYHPIIDIVMDPENGATDSMHHFRLDFRVQYGSFVPAIKQFAFKMLTDMTGVQYTNIFIDNFRASREMDTINYRDTICPGMSYSGYGFSVDSTETLTPGLLSYTHEVMECYGMVCYRLLLLVEAPVTTHIDTTLALGDTLFFRDSLIVDIGDYVFPLASMRGCDSTVVLHVRGEEVSLSASSQRICPGEEVILTASGIHTFQWYSVPFDPALNIQQGQTPAIVHPMENTMYQLMDANGMMLASAYVEMEICEGIWIPNIFTPNAETNNGFFIQTNLPVEAFEITIYTRTGLLVWHCEDINQMWDGTRDGVPLPQGSYVFHWRLKSSNRIRTGIGTVTLLR